MRVLVVDAHPDVRWALRTAIREEAGLTVAGEVAHAEDLLEEARALRPDVILLEWELPDTPGEELLASLGSLDLGCRVIVLGGQPEVKEAALAAGADDFVSKADAPEPLLRALRRLVHE
jgi:DNA-binding NarL/FixJ family response regulator